MFTAIIADKEYIDKLQEYELFLKPFMDKKKIAFCQWNSQYTSLKDAVPELYDAIGRRKEWRAVIICDEKGLAKRNPFDVADYEHVKYQAPAIEVSEDALSEKDLHASETQAQQKAHYEEYLKNEHLKKIQAYNDAAENPLTRLVTFLCESPSITKSLSLENISEDTFDATFNVMSSFYLKETEEKQRLRSQILNGEIIPIAKPQQILCIARRTCPLGNEELENAWSSHTEMEYSRFYDRNMYFEKMRYLVFDILPRTQKSYSFEYVKFLYATILLASNEIPFGCLSPNRVYSLNCENDEDSLKNLLFAYEAKLDTTKCMLEQRIKDISSKQKKRLTDTEAEQIFCAKVDVPVALSSDFDKSELFVSTDGIGLSNGCPSEEEVLWESRYRKSKKTLSKLLKQSNRAVKRAAADARQEDNFYYGDVSLLNEFQLEDVCEHITNEELNMIATHPPDLYDEEPFLKEMETEDTAIKNKIRRRMYRNTTLIIAVSGILAYMVGFFTLFYRNSSSNAFNTTVSVIITLSALGLIALIAFVTLFFLKRALIKLFKRYNWVMHGIDNDVHEAMGKYSNYLSHMCNVRRGYAVLNATVESRDPDRERIILYRKHIMDIEAAKEEARDVFGVYMSEKPSCDLSGLSGYDYNFDRPCEYTYPIPYSEGNVRTIDFLQAGLRAEVPVDFIKSLTVRREELYE